MSEYKKSLNSLGAVFVSAFLVAGCATTDTDPSRVEDDFGNSVRHMVNAQIYDPVAAQNPPEAPPMGIDGVQAEAAIDVYRKSVGDPKDVTKALRIEVSE